MDDGRLLPSGRRVPRWVPVAANYRGKPLSVYLGLALAVVVVGSVSVVAGLAWMRGRGPLSPGAPRAFAALGGLLLVFAAGVYDDVRGKDARGIRGHLRELLAGHVSTGVVKALAATCAGALITIASGARGVRLPLGTAVVAGATNLWNLLDVRPGRAIKFFLPVGALLFVPSGAGYGLVVGMALGAAAGALWFDVREWAMLGDSGANVLGYVAGIGLLASLSTVGLAIALGLILVLHGLAETVTLSRIIQAVPPLRWFDRLGRLKLADEQGEEGPGEHSSSG